MFLSTAKALKKNDASLVLLNPAPLVKEALDAAGFGGIIKTAESIDEAEAFLKG
jgi:anti-anti-sigma regulatory factor